MSITSNLYTGVSGLNSHSDAMNIISDNIANVNTVGYKRGRGNFADVLGSHIGGERVGQGSMIGSVQLSFSQGSLIGTGNVTDLAMQGDGFFIVEGTVNGRGGSHYTRNGAFSLDGDGFVVNAEGLRVQGFGVDTGGNVAPKPGDLQLQFSSIPPNPTTEMSIIANLDAGTPVDPTPFDINDPGGTSDFSTAITVYDSLGKAHQIDVFFKKTQDDPNATWDYHVAADGDELNPQVPNSLVSLGQGTATFNPDGSLDNFDVASVNADWLGANSESIAIDFGSQTGNGGTGVDGLTTYSAASNSGFLSQNGFGSGDLAGITFDQDGMMFGQFSNGQERAIGQLALAKFANNDGLSREGAGLYQSTDDAGIPMVGTANTGGRGSIVSGNLEGSNVNLAQEFVEMITVQRGFQGNSKSVTTADEMLNEVLSLKR